MLALLLTAGLLKAGPIDLTFKVDGIDRRAIVYASSVKDKPSPVVFVFHGFTGNAKHAAFAYRVHNAWPEATVVYPQGLEVNLLNRKGPGWQIAPRMQDNRDLKFYDAMLAKVKSDFMADPKRIYTCGMSNGAVFSYVLLSERASTLAAAAPVAGFAAPAFKGAPATPILIIHGKADTLISISAAERSRAMAIANNGVGSKEEQWASGYVKYTPAPKGMDVIWHVHEGGHEWPSNVTESIIRFFKAHART